MYTHGVCEKPTRKYPEGRTGTAAGEKAHRDAKEKLCEPCRENQAKRSRDRHTRKNWWRQVNPDDYELACEVPKKSTPQGRRGTTAGFSNHKTRGEEPCSECQEAQRIRDRNKTKESYHKYQDRKLEYQAKYREENKEKIRISARDYYVRNKEKFRENKESRTSRILELPRDGHSKQDITDTHGTTCYLCLHEVDPDGEAWRADSPHVDHVHPIIDKDCPGDILSNVRWTHARCNLRKGNRFLHELELPFSPPGGDLVECDKETLKEEEI